MRPLNNKIIKFAIVSSGRMFAFKEAFSALQYKLLMSEALRPPSV